MPKSNQIKKNHNGKAYLPLVLVVLDGWGISAKQEGNAIAQAKLPNYRHFLSTYQNTRLQASGRAVGLPADQSGNSEAGHMNIGAGRVVEQDGVTISRSISNGTFFKNPALIQAAEHADRYKSNVHIMSLLSDGQSPHADNDHLLALISFFQNKTKQNIYLHIFTDGRDSPMFSALKILDKYKTTFSSPRVKIATVMGRFYAMDRRRAWDRTKAAYEAMTRGKGIKAKNAVEGINAAYNRGESDEYIAPTVICKKGKPCATIGKNDTLVFSSLRSDRARQLTKVFAQEDFTKNNPNSFARPKKIANLFFVGLTDFGPDLDNVLTAFPGIDIPDTIVSVLRNYKQMYIAEREKYAHVTYFFNGGYDHAIVGETRVTVASKKIKRYDQYPQMSTSDIASRIVRAVKVENYNIVVANFAGPDMVGHTANLEAAIKAVEYIDAALGKISQTVLSKGGTLIITADHGNVEEMLNTSTQEVVTEHSTNPVPFIVVSNKLKSKLRNGGKLGDIAPTILDILHIKKPKLMTGRSLIKK